MTKSDDMKGLYHSKRIFVIAIAGLLLVFFVFSGASCSQKQVTTIDQGSETAIQTNTNTTEQESKNINANQINSTQGDIEAIVSSELTTATNDQAAVSSTDTEDRALVTSDAEAFGGVGAIEPIE